MDPVSQGALGAAFSQSLHASRQQRREYLVAASLFGCAAGMAPDLDVFIQSSTDPLLFLEYHRHFTHSLVFIPFGAAIVTAVLYRLFKHPLSWRDAYFYSLVGYATHGLLDACTTYGTQLFWPFSNYRVAWNNVSVVDPLFTLPLLILVILAIRRVQPRLAYWGVAWAISYLLLGQVQHERAYAAAENLAQQRGHQPTRLSVKPGFANLILWKAIYQHDNRYYVDGLRVTVDTTWCPGDSVAVFDQAQQYPELNPDSQQARDIERFRWFSQDYLAVDPDDGLIIDARYSMLPNQIDSLWGIRVDPTEADDAHVTWHTNRRADASVRQQLYDQLTGRSCGPLDVSLRTSS